MWIRKTVEMSFLPDRPAMETTQNLYKETGTIFWLMNVRDCTKWISFNVTDIEGSSATFKIALKSKITTWVTSNYSFCQNTTQF
jgi:hypothetical protein